VWGLLSGAIEREAGGKPCRRKGGKNIIIMQTEEKDVERERERDRKDRMEENDCRCAWNQKKDVGMDGRMEDGRDEREAQKDLQFTFSSLWLRIKSLCAS